MRVGIHQLHYLPWLRYFEKIARSDAFIVLDNIQFNKNGWQNRNRVKSANGATLLTVPVLAKQGQTLDRVVIDNRANWRRKHRDTLRQCYSKAPHFDRYWPFFEQTYARDWAHLHDLNAHMLAFYLEALGIGTRVEYASALDVPGLATERLVNLIRAVGGDTYYSGAYALDVYLDAATFEAAGIGLDLQEWHCPSYPQLHGPFVADLAVVDLLMNCGDKALDVLLGCAHDRA